MILQLNVLTSSRYRLFRYSTFDNCFQHHYLHSLLDSFPLQLAVCHDFSP